MAYLLCPFDLVPDFIPLVGYVDDMAVIAKLIGIVIGGCKKDNI